MKKCFCRYREFRSLLVQGSVGKKAEEGNLSESEDENLFQIPASGDFSEYE